MKARVGIVGCGAIGRTVARALRSRGVPGRLVAVCDVNSAAARRLARGFRPVPGSLALDELVRRVDVVVECASAAAAPSVLAAVARWRRDAVFLSVAGLVSRPDLLDRARRKGCRVTIPSGAIGGVDALRAASIGRLTSVTLVTSKPAASLRGAPHFRGRIFPAAASRRPVTVFRGSAARAARGFPANLNVAATLLLSGAASRKTRVTIVADPRLRGNRHELSIVGSFGRAYFRVDNTVSPENPRTSRLAAYAAVDALKSVLQGVRGRR